MNYIFSANQKKKIFESLFNPNISYSNNDYKMLLDNYNRGDILETINASNENLHIDTIKELFINDFDKVDDTVNITLNKPMHTRFKDQKIIFPANPFDVKSYPTTALSSLDYSYETNHKYIVMDYSKTLKDNTFYCVLADEFIEHLSSIDIDQSIMSNISLMKLYYPFLSYESENIDNLKTLLEKGSPEETFTLNDIHYDIIDLHEIINKKIGKKQELQQKYGIQKSEVILKPNFSVVLSLEQLFKHISASKTFPFIKFNPGKNQENLYRLFSEKNNTRGKKIPFLEKAMIFKIDKRANKSKSIVLQYYYNDSIFILELLSDGSVLISYDGENSFTDQDDLQNKLVSIINDFISFITPYIHTIQNLYTPAKDINSKNIEIVTFDYVLNFKVKKMMNIKKFIKCFSPIFSIENVSDKKGVKMRYKRVSNFNEMNSIDAFICEKINQNKTDAEIIEEIELNFDMNYEKAKDSYVSYMSQIALEENTDFIRRRRQLKNPGFGVMITRINSFYQVFISKINDLSHIPLLLKYISNLFYLNEGIYVMDKEKSAKCMVSTVIDSMILRKQNQKMIMFYKEMVRKMFKIWKMEDKKKLLPHFN